MTNVSVFGFQELHSNELEQIDGGNLFYDAAHAIGAGIGYLAHAWWSGVTYSGDY